MVNINTRLISLLAIVSTLITIAISTQPALAEKNAVPLENFRATASTEQIESKQLDTRASILQAYLARYNSPLTGHAGDFIEAADKHSLDWRLVAAISGVESTFGKRIPGGYNAWGWGVYGTQAIYFKSWREGIFTVSEGLKRNYIDRGLTDPYSINRIYAASKTWGAHVSYFLNDLDRFSKDYDKTIKTRVPPSDLTLNVAGTSALLADK